MTDNRLWGLAERFCATELPASLCADLVAIKPMTGRKGTNLMTVIEAKKILSAIFSSELLIAVADAKGFVTLHQPDEDGKPGDIVFSAWGDDWANYLNNVAVAATIPATGHAATEGEGASHADRS